MKKIKLYIVSYNNYNDLNNNLESLFNSDWFDNNLEINIINNHSNFSLDHKYINKVKILHNLLRPDWSTGHLARNWNQAIINGFKDLNNPDCDIVICCQDDTLFDINWLPNLLKFHEKYDFIQMGIGDNFCSYGISAIKTIGLWDERFCTIQLGEADYFLRALIYNKEKTCLNDYQHGRLINNIDHSFITRPKPAHIFSIDHRSSMKFFHINEKVFKMKWGDTPYNYWDAKTLNNPPQNSLIFNFITYPYFEKDIDNLQNKGYIF